MVENNSWSDRMEPYQEGGLVYTITREDSDFVNEHRNTDREVPLSLVDTENDILYVNTEESPVLVADSLPVLEAASSCFLGYSWEVMSENAAERIRDDDTESFEKYMADGGMRTEELIPEDIDSLLEDERTEDQKGRGSYVTASDGYNPQLDRMNQGREVSWERF